ncbi:4-(cytidine 5'-diphospho)-2-C-methyl-D-erythritol kinase [Persephonella sp.]
MEKFEINAPAKVNLGLWIVGKRADGYHEIFTLFHTVDFYDRIFITPYHRFKVETTNPSIKPEENTVLKAVKKFEEWTGIFPEFSVFIEKNIPVGAGLGGGSSDAAAVLNFINRYYGAPLSEEELHTLASTVGADVPFFLKGGFAVGEGIGDKLKFFDKRLNSKIFIIYPNVAVPTSQIYKKVSPDMLTRKEEIPIIDSLLEEFDSFLEHLENTLGKIVEESYPEVREVVNTLRFLGYRPLVSGSGSSVFAFGEPTEEVERLCKLKNWKLIKTALK